MENQRPDQRREKYLRMTTTPVEKLILKLSVPTVASMLVTAAYNLADTFFVSNIGGHEGTLSVAAVSVAFSVMALIQAFGFFVGQGSANTISRLLGRQDIDRASELAATGLFCAAVLGLLVCVLGEIFAAPFARVLGAKDEFLPHTVAYLRWIFAAAPMMTCSFCLNNQLRFQGNAVYAMFGVMSGAVLNVILDPIFIHVLGMHAEGAALATAISQVVGFSVLFAGTFRGDNLRIHPKRIRLSARNLSDIVRGGLPSLLRQGFAALSVSVLNNMAGRVGEATEGIDSASLIAAFGLVSKIMTTVNYVVIGLGQGYQPVCGFNYGAGLYSRVRKAFWFLVKATGAWCLLVAIFGELFSARVVSVFPDVEPLVRDLAVTILRFQCVTILVNCWVVPSNMTQQTMGWAASASALAMARQGCFLIPLALLLPRFFGLIGLEVAQPLADFCTFLLAIPLQVRVLRHLRQPDREEAA